MNQVDHSQTHQIRIDEKQEESSKKENSPSTSMTRRANPSKVEDFGQSNMPFGSQNSVPSDTAESLPRVSEAGSESETEKDGARRQPNSSGIAEASRSHDAGHPELPNPPCSTRNQQAWPFDFQKLGTHRIGRVRPMVWPCTCQAKLSDGKICGRPHPTKIHADHDKFLEIWLPKHVAGTDLHSGVDISRHPTQQDSFNCVTQGQETGAWRLIPGCPTETLDEHLQSFVNEVSNDSAFQPFHISFYSPNHFDPPARELGWPEPLPGPLRLTVGYVERGSNPVTMNQWFERWCEESAKEIRMGLGVERED